MKLRGNCSDVGTSVYMYIRPNVFKWVSEQPGNQL